MAMRELISYLTCVDKSAEYLFYPVSIPPRVDQPLTTRQMANLVCIIINA